MSPTPSRTPPGTPTGGQFAATQRDESDIDLGAPATAASVQWNEFGDGSAYADTEAHRLTVIPVPFALNNHSGYDYRVRDLNDNLVGGGTEPSPEEAMRAAADVEESTRLDAKSPAVTSAEAVLADAQSHLALAERKVHDAAIHAMSENVRQAYPGAKTLHITGGNDDYPPYASAITTAEDKVVIVSHVNKNLAANLAAMSPHLMPGTSSHKVDLIEQRPVSSN